jgi:penicillin-binding protein 1A
MNDNRPADFREHSGPDFGRELNDAVPAPDATPGRRRWRIRPQHVLLGILALFALIVAWLAFTAPLNKSLQPIAAPSLTLLSADGQPIARRGAVIAEPVAVAELPEHVWQPFLAIEDRRFYNHLGIDPQGIARAMLRNVGAGGVREGGSTITQQLAKISFLSHERTAGRKLQEMLIAFWLEAWLDKDDILSRYLSNVYLGDNVYGLRAAARHYFDREPQDLTVEQSAMLAGMVKAPSRLAPTNNLKAAQDRSMLVINAMVESGVLSEEEAARLRPARVRRGDIKNIPTGTYFADWIMPAARAALAEAPYGEQTVTTTLDSRLQRLAVRTVRNAGLGRGQAALVAMRTDGQVVAMVGGKNYSDSAFNRVTQAKRQPGSAFKPIVYLAALSRGMTPESRIDDSPITINGWTPRNNDGQHRGAMSLREALAISSNTATVRLQEQIGRDNVIRTARQLGITSDLTQHPSLALGASGIPLIEMTAAYAAIAGGSYPVTARGLPQPPEGWFDRWWPSTARFSHRQREGMLDMLWAVANQGTGRAAALAVPTFGKTGTSQDNRDALFIGFAGDLVVGVWIGNDDNSPLPGIGGGGLPAQIWRHFMTQALGTEAGRPRPLQQQAPVAIEQEPEAQPQPQPSPSSGIVTSVNDFGGTDVMPAEPLPNTGNTFPAGDQNRAQPQRPGPNEPGNLPPPKATPPPSSPRTQPPGDD